MKKMKIYMKLKSALVLGLFTLTACTGNYRDFNMNPDNVPDSYLDMDGLRYGSAITSMELDMIPCSDQGANAYQRAQNLTGDIFSGQLCAIGVWNGCSNNTTYNLRFDNWNDVMFNIAFTTIMPAWKRVCTEENREKEPVTYAIAQVLKVAAMHRCTDNYGPLPYFQFGNGAMTTPYDAQDKIYESFFKDLNEAIDILEDFCEKNPDARPLKKYDLVYEGNITKWAKFANTLKLRLAMRIVYVDPTNAQKYAEEAVSTSRGVGVMTENDDNAMLHSANGIVVYHPLRVIWAMYNETCMGSTMESFLKGYSDGRIGKYFHKSTLEGGDYHGARNGIIIDDQTLYQKLSTPNIEASNKVKWMCAAEAYFLRAEGALRKWNMEGDAKGLYETGVSTSFAEWEANIGSYLTNKDAKPAKYDDPIGNNSYSARTEITPVYDEKASVEENLERILTQKWIALYPEGQEAWTEFRRTGYPKIMPVANNFSNGAVDTEIQIRRVTFPQQEYDGNNAEVQRAVSLLGGPDTGGTKLWWDKKK